MNILKIINPEKVAYWFFRLNGCMTIENFVVHPDYRSASQRTDVDVLGVRFPHRAELLTSGTAMKDHACFSSKDKIDVFLAEVKHGMCRLNGPWTNPPDENMFRVLYAIGAFPLEQVPIVAQALYDQGMYLDNQYQVRLFAIGNEKNSNLLPDVIQLEWGEILDFIYLRFVNYRDPKAHHEQWDSTGKRLFWYAIHMTIEEFTETIKDEMRNYVSN
ncbi:MAG: hypothetical protein WCY93_09340 [Anaerolineaceae bacterium]